MTLLYDNINSAHAIIVRLMFTADNDYDIYGTLESVNTWREK